MTDKTESRTLLENALTKIRTLKKQLQDKQDKAQPIAIVGMACRLPGSANNTEQFWRNLLDGKNGVVDLSNLRWNNNQYYDPVKPAKGKTYLTRAGLIDRPFNFDAKFFNISPREAEWMDPQQRQLLEVSWEALENAGMRADEIRGANAGVYVGIMNKDHSDLMAQQLLPEQLIPLMNTGNHESVHSGRLSYFFDFHGPCLTLNTACSSSLLSIHLACQALRNQECEFALAGGCNMLLSPFGSIAQSQATMHSTDGYCKTFDASADGYVRSEGCAMIVLKPLASALRDNDQIHSVILGSAINQDGLSQGITAPNGRSQEVVMRAALANAQIKPDEVAFVEAHGTGTKLGDPIEVRALGAVYGRAENRHSPLYVGALKTNIGHCESAAGVAGLIKLTQVLKTGDIPKNLHYQTVNKDIDLQRENITLCSQPMRWPVSRKRIGAVSAFGFSGSNAHLILAAPDPVEEVTENSRDRDHHILRISGKGPKALKANINRAIEFLGSQSKEHGLADICYSYNTGRCNFTNSVLVHGKNHDEIIHALTQAEKDLSETLNQRIRQKNKNALIIGIFTGDDFGFCVELYKTSSVFFSSYNALKDKIDNQLDGDLELGRMSFSSSNANLIQAICLYAIKSFLFELNLNPEIILSEYNFKKIFELMSSNASLQSWCENIHGILDELSERKVTENKGYCYLHEERRLELIDWSSAIDISRDSVSRLISVGKIVPPTILQDVLTLNLSNTEFKYLWENISSHLCMSHKQGLSVDLTAWDGGYSRSKITVPTYAFQGKEFWLDCIDRSAFGCENLKSSIHAKKSVVADIENNDLLSPDRYLLKVISNIAKVDVSEIELNAKLVETMGFDSIMIVELRSRLSSKYASLQDMPFDLLYNSEISQIVEYVDNKSGLVLVEADPEAKVPEWNNGLFLTPQSVLPWLDNWGRDIELYNKSDLIENRLNKKWVHKHNHANVLIGSMDQVENTNWYCAEMYRDNDHDFFYEHPQDHIPGLYLIEAARQLGMACAHKFQSVPLNVPFVLDDMRVQFDHFAEKDIPVYMLCQFTDTLFVDEVLHRIQQKTYFVQDKKILGQISGRGVIMDPKVYKTKRSIEAVEFTN